MASVQSSPIDIVSSPRSTVLGTSGHMTTNLSSMNDSNMATGLADSDAKVATPADSPDPAQQDAASTDGGKETTATKEGNKETKKDNVEEEAETQVNAPLASHPQATATGYYLGYPHQNGTPPSPTVAGHVVTALPYDASIGSFMQQQGSFAAAHTSPFGVPGTTTPLSPPRSTINTAGMVGVPPASPLFPRVNSGGLEGTLMQQGVVAPQSPSLPYMSPALGSYAGVARSNTGGSSDDASWDNRYEHIYLSWGKRCLLFSSNACFLCFRVEIKITMRIRLPNLVHKE